MILMHFTATWCQPCKMMKPIVEQIVHERGDLSYMAVDVDDDPQTASDYDVMSVPKFVLLGDDGTILAEVVGAMPRQKFLDHLNL